jgi:pimeloyl-ACP methyl ester carboxylesterase
MPHAALAGVDRQAFAAALAPIFGHDLADQPPIAMAQLGAMRRYDRAADFAHLSGIPSLVLSASDDRIAKPAYGRELAAAIPGSHYVEITDAGHGVPIHRADDVNARLAAFWLAS